MPPQDDYAWIKVPETRAEFLRQRLRGAAGPVPRLSRDEDWHDLLVVTFERADPEDQVWFRREAGQVLYEFWEAESSDDAARQTFRRAVDLAVRIKLEKKTWPENLDIFPERIEYLIQPNGSILPNHYQTLLLLRGCSMRNLDFWTEAFDRLTKGLATEWIRAAAVSTAAFAISRERRLTRDEMALLFRKATPLDEVGFDLIIDIIGNHWVSCVKAEKPPQINAWLQDVRDALETVAEELSGDLGAQKVFIDSIGHFVRGYKCPPESKLEFNRLRELGGCLDSQPAEVAIRKYHSWLQINNTKRDFNPTPAAPQRSDASSNFQAPKEQRHPARGDSKPYWPPESKAPRMECRA